MDFLLKTDRISTINGFHLCGIQNYDINRRNVECYSQKLEKYIKEYNLSKTNFDLDYLASIDKILHEILDKELLDDIVLVKVLGYF
jgi:hypothetical protein